MWRPSGQNCVKPLHPNITLYVIPLKQARGMRSRLEYMFRVRRLMRDLQESQRFDLVHQLNPVFTGVSLALTGIRSAAGAGHLRGAMAG